MQTKLKHYLKNYRQLLKTNPYNIQKQWITGVIFGLKLGITALREEKRNAQTK